MEMMLKKVTIIIIVLLVVAGCLPKPEPRTGDFNAVVIDSLTGEGVSGVDIQIGENEYDTDLKGQFSLAGLPPGDYQICISREWYESKMVTYKHLGKPEPVTFFLEPASFTGRIYYSYDEGQDKEIYELILENRTVNKVLSLPESGETNPAWSESQIFAVESISGKVSKIKVYDFTMGNYNPILFQDSIFGEHPSLDSRGITMALKSNGKIIKYDLNNNKEIKSFDLAGWNPVISPNGTMVAYVSGNYTKLYIYTNESEFDEFIPKPGFKINNPCWSPDGEKIAFEAYENSEEERAIYWIAVDSLDSGMYQVTFPSGNEEQHKHPTWGENDMIYFSGNIVYSSRSDIYAVKFYDKELESNPWIMVSKGSGNKLYPCWGK